MMILKVCTRDRTHWFPGIQDLVEERSFLTTGPDPLADLLKDMGPKDELPPVLHVCGFEELTDPNPEFPVDKMVGKLLSANRPGGPVVAPEGWVVPANHSYVMSESGKTIERI